MRSQFIANGYVVLAYVGVAVMPVGDDKQEVDVRVPAVMVLRVVDGRIAEHQDFVDHASLKAQETADVGPVSAASD